MRSALSGDFVRFVLVVAILIARCAYAQQKAPVPDAAALEAAQKAAGELFGARFRSAKTAADKSAVAVEMIEAALRLEDGSADQYVLLKISREIASGAGEVATALQAAEEQAKRFDVPAAKLKAETLLAAAHEAKATAQHKAVAEAALQLVKDWTDAGEVELPLSVCEAGRSAAQKAREFKLVKELAARAGELEKQRKVAQEYRQALAVMEKEPVEPAANLTAGRYLCFVVGDWDRGVPYLALGSDPGLKAVALQELRGAASADAQAAIGDMWWALGETKRGSERDALLLRAGAWYRQAEPRLSGGLAGLKAKQRLTELAKLGREIPKLCRAATTAPPSPLAIAPFDETTAKQHQAAWAEYLQLPVVLTNSIGMKLVLIPPGEFEMIAAADQKGARVRITKPFYLGQCEVTQEQHQRVMGNNPSKFKGAPNLPAESVSWTGAVEFCQKLNELSEEKTSGAVYRLPTEAEWDYACRAGTTPRQDGSYYSADIVSQHAWWKANSEGQTHPVGQLRPNPWNLFDMRGNVAEWLADWSSAEHYTNPPSEDPTGPPSGERRVVRGGYYLQDDPGGFVWLWRHSEAPLARASGLGFRVARTVPLPASAAASGPRPPTAITSPAGNKPAGPTPPLAVVPFDANKAKDHQAAWARHLGVPVEMTNSIGMRFVLIPPGEFDMGSSEAEITKLEEEGKAKNLKDYYFRLLLAEAPKHRVRITRPFYLGQCEMTQAQYERAVGTNPSQFQGDPNRPVEQVNWIEAAAFCRRLAELPQEQAAGARYRLPTEAEWDYACRAGTVTAWYCGDDEAALKDHAWFSANALSMTHPVGQKASNAWGLNDMYGNVWEWCQDWWGERYDAASPVDDPAGASGGLLRSCRGGCWNNEPAEFRTSFRGRYDPAMRSDARGFRVVRSLPGK